jgi:hypothetical protein
LSTAEIAAEEEVRILLIGEKLADGVIRNGCPGVVEKLRIRVDIVAVPALPLTQSDERACRFSGS